MLREIVVLDDNSNNKIISKQVLREVLVFMLPQELKSSVIVREILVDTNPKQNPDVVLVVA